MEKGKKQEGAYIQGGKYMLDKFYTTTQTVVNAENLIPLNSCEYWVIFDSEIGTISKGYLNYRISFYFIPN